MILNRATCTMMTHEEYEAFKAYGEELAFQRQPRQGEVTCPMIIRDGLGVQGLQSQADGKFYDSKRALRKHYRDAGVVEIGNDVPQERQRPPKEVGGRKKRMDAIGKAFNRVGLPTT